MSDSRGGEYLSALTGVIDELDDAGIVHRVLYLEADDQTLLSRYKETRRRHPLAPHGTVVDGIARERELMGPVRERADTCIDTSGLSSAGLRGRRRARLSEAPLSVTFTSFGHKHGPPRDPDLAFDVRFLPNPLRGRPAPAHRLRPADRRLRRARRAVAGVLRHVVPLLEYLLPSTWPRARRISSWRSAAPAAATARWRSPSV